MRTLPKLLLLLLIAAFSKMSSAQEVFVTIDGFKSGLSKQEVKKIKVDDPLQIQENKIMYADVLSGANSVYNFVNDKLVSITEMHDFFDKKKSASFYEKIRKQFIDLYGPAARVTPGSSKKDQDTMVWNVKGSEVRLATLEYTVTISYELK